VGVELPSWLLASACIVRTLAALCFLLGLWTRVAGLVVGVSGYLVLIQNPFGFVATLDLLYQGSIVLALADSGASLALRPEPARNPASSLLLIRVFLGSIYFWAAFVKLRPDWLDGRTLELFLHDGALRGYVAELLLGGPLRRTFAAWMIALTELSLPVLLLWPRTRRISVFIALGLHGLIELCAQPDLLGFGMGALLLCLLPPPEAPSRFSHKRPRSRARQ
jgi:uncharacterized membrane protein YphA (DoxX/SURF4 family)